MILAIVGVIILISAMGEGNTPVIIVGAVLICLGLLISSVLREQNRAEGNRRRYWAYGERPEWKSNPQRARRFRPDDDDEYECKCGFCGCGVHSNDKICRNCGKWLV